MKITGKGVIAILVFFVAFPVFIDLVIRISAPKNPEVSMSSFLVSAYIRYLPFYLVYLAIALCVIYLFNRYKKYKRESSNGVPDNHH
jgi:hypothetical protein